MRGIDNSHTPYKPHTASQTTPHKLRIPRTTPHETAHVLVRFLLFSDLGGGQHARKRRVHPFGVLGAAGDPAKGERQLRELSQ